MGVRNRCSRGDDLLSFAYVAAKERAGRFNRRSPCGLLFHFPILLPVPGVILSAVGSSVVRQHSTLASLFVSEERSLTCARMASCRAPVCLWYGFLTQLFCLQGRTRMVTAARRILPIMFVMEGVSHHSFLLDLNGASGQLILLGRVNAEHMAVWGEQDRSASCLHFCSPHSRLSRYSRPSVYSR